MTSSFHLTCGNYQVAQMYQMASNMPHATEGSF
jgi:hypothetical protein